MKIKIKIKNISEIDYEEMSKNVYVVYFIATYGEGGPTDDCIEFNNFLEKNKSGLNNNIHNVNYSVFGLGSSKYEFFNQMAKKFDKFLEKSGGNRYTE